MRNEQRRVALSSLYDRRCNALDLSKLVCVNGLGRNALVRAGSRDKAIRKTLSAPFAVVRGVDDPAIRPLLATLGPLVRRAATGQITLDLGSTVKASHQRPARTRKSESARLQPLPKPGKYPVRLTDGPLSEFDTEVTIPFGFPRFITVLTLKQLAGAEQNDSVFRQMATGTWEFVGEDDVIDLADRSQAYRIGRLTVYS